MSLQLPRLKSRFSKAFTLIELMVTLAIISVLATIALPSIKNSLREQRVSRAASLIQSAMEEARARSISNGGGGGIIIDRLGATNVKDRAQSIRIRMAQSPPAYSGEPGATTGTIAVFDDDGSPTSSSGAFKQKLAFWVSNSSSMLDRSASDYLNGSLPTLVNIGDEISLGNEELPFHIESIQVGIQATSWLTGFGDLELGPISLLDPTTSIRIVLGHTESNANYRRFHGKQVGYTIMRSPSPAISLPVELPAGTAIDLTASGIGRYGNEFSPFAVDGNYTDTTIAPYTNTLDDYFSIWVIFGGNGAISRVRTFHTDPISSNRVFGDIPVTGDVHFLVGRRDEVKTEPVDQLEDDDPNPLDDDAKDGTTPILDRESIWVSIRSRSGDVTSSSWVDPTDDTLSIIVPADMAITNPNQRQQTRVQRTLGRVRTAATELIDVGSK